jgi:hypothetical protein
LSTAQSAHALSASHFTAHEQLFSPGMKRPLFNNIKEKLGFYKGGFFFSVTFSSMFKESAAAVLNVVI